MARPAEKARAMMNKWVAMRDGDNHIDHNKRNNNNRRPYLASECEHLIDAEKFRKQIIYEITNNISKIQNPTLSEYEIRELNDTINKLQREKYHWNKRIYQLGGIDYNTIERKRQIEQISTGNDDTTLQSSSSSYASYKYYGMAKTLPGVQEHIQKENEKYMKSKIKRTDIHKVITPDYFGFRDEEDGILFELEHNATQQLVQQYNIKTTPTTPTLEPNPQDQQNDNNFVSNLPSQQDISKIILQMKKNALLKKYSL
jgi:pre-mRNA-splicing factor ISY1